MDEEEKEAIKEAKKQIEEAHNFNDINIFMADTITLKTLLNYIDKLQKVIDLMAFEIAKNTGSCPLDSYDWKSKKCDNCNNTYKECFIEYFYKKAEEEND